eukprot:TRINITY_DN5777_c0_g1_i2.p1 TRINITY_DN5777_c0_g1~~TRINITY_DN5777_c0_g1_i2.p1  ORF type:complete len:1074 (+),score=253.14 TRINITY_DN5777_c0_g1_i2:169-3390(+)
MSGNTDVTRIRAADGYVFEVTSDVARLAPVFNCLLEDGDRHEEMPVPVVRHEALALLLGQLQRKRDTGHFDVACFVDSEAELEQLSFAADCLGVDSLFNECLLKLASSLLTSVGFASRASAWVLRRLLFLAPGLIHEEQTAAIVLAYANRFAKEADADASASIFNLLYDASIKVRVAAVTAVAKLAPGHDGELVGILVNVCKTGCGKELQLAGLRSLKKLAPEADRTAFDFALEFVASQDSEQRNAALALLASVAKRGDVQAVKVAIRRLQGTQAVDQLTAVRSLQQLAVAGDANIINVLMDRLEECGEEVRCATVEALSVLAGKGDDLAITAVLKRVTHRFWWVRRVALQVLRQIANAGDPRVMKKLFEQLEQRDAAMRGEALAALPNFASHGDEKVLTALWGLLVGPVATSEPLVRATLLQALGKLGRGSEAAIQISFSQLRSLRDCVRKLALEALAVVAPRGDDRVVSEVLACVGSADDGLRVAALTALRRLATPQEPRIVMVVTKKTLDECDSVRQSALEAFDDLVGRGNRDALRMLTAGMGSRCSREQQAATVALRRALKPGDKEGLQKIAKQMRSSDQALRQAAVATLEHLARDGGPRQFAAVLDIGMNTLEQGRGFSKSAAADLLQRLAPRGDTGVLDALTQQLENCNKDSLRDVLIRVIMHVASSIPSSKPFAAALGRCLAHKKCTMRCMALGAFEEVIEPGNSRAISSASTGLAHACWQVRWTAAAAILCVARKALKAFARAGVGEASDAAAAALGHIEEVVRTQLRSRRLAVRQVASYVLEGLRPGRMTAVDGLVELARQTAQQIEEQEAVAATVEAGGAVAVSVPRRTATLPAAPSMRARITTVSTSSISRHLVANRSGPASVGKQLPALATKKPVPTPKAAEPSTPSSSIQKRLKMLKRKTGSASLRGSKAANEKVAIPPSSSSSIQKRLKMLKRKTGSASLRGSKAANEKATRPSLEQLAGALDGLKMPPELQKRKQDVLTQHMERRGAKASRKEEANGKGSLRQTPPGPSKVQVKAVRQQPQLLHKAPSSATRPASRLSKVSAPAPPHVQHTSKRPRIL